VIGRRAAGVLLVATLVAVAPPANSSRAQNVPEPASVVEDFSAERIGSATVSFSPQAGFWSIASEDGRPVLVEDGSQWQGSGLAASLADQARSAYGERWAEFIDDLAETAYFPLAIYNGVDSVSDGTLSMHFKILGGNLDQDAGLAFNVQPNGDFMALRSDTEENNLLLYQWIQGQGMPLKRVDRVPTALGDWHEQTLIVSGAHVTGLLDGRVYLDAILDAPVSGGVGLWSKTDTVVLFDRFSVADAPAPAPGTAGPAANTGAPIIRVQNLDRAVEFAQQANVPAARSELQEFVADWTSIAEQVRRVSPESAQAIQDASGDALASLSGSSPALADQFVYVQALLRLQQVVHDQQQRLTPQV
jgi:hypothetical protein